MGKLTDNKPKCLISVNGTTILQTISISFPDATLHIIGDYRIDVLRSYLEVISPDFEYRIIHATGNGTNAGITDALNYIPEGEHFAISWSDLFYKSPISIPDENKNYVGLTNSNRCRYSFKGGKFREEETYSDGVIGLFFFKNKSLLSDLPKSGEFVRYLSSTNIDFFPIIVDSVYEIGTLENYMAFKAQFPISRFFNNVEIKEDKVIKRASNFKFKHLLVDEINWYKYMNKMNYTAIPKVQSFEPLILERIVGSHPHQIKASGQYYKLNLVEKIIDQLNVMHSITQCPASMDDLYNVYVNKTLERIQPVTKMLKINSNKNYIVNGKKIKTIIPADPEIIKFLFHRLWPISSFCPIHGDPTFSNTLITNKNEVKFIDPRGYFGNSKIFGDPRYDLAKLYYSTNGNYDQFNNGNFKISLNFPEIDIKIKSSHFEFMDEFFQEKLKNLYDDVKILHALIWLSLSGYVLNDYDAMVAAYFMGLYYLDGVLNG